MVAESTFGVYPRKMKSGKVVYYYWAYKSNGKRIYRSTRAETYEKAIRYCRNLLKIGKLASDEARVFSKYTENFFIYEKCPYIQNVLLMLNLPFFRQANKVC